MSQGTIAIVGAGIGGLSAAARLAKRGFEVHVFEKNAQPGGRCARLDKDGFQFDMGPTLLLMPEVVEDTFAVLGRKASDYLSLHRCDPNYQVHFRDGAQLEMSTDMARMQAEFERFEKGSGEGLLKFLATGAHQYRVSLDHFVGRNFDHLGQFLTPSKIGEIFKVKALSTMYREVAKLFADPRLRSALTFQTMYLGISPYEAPAVYGLLPFVELALGIHFPKGGMHAIPRALETVGKELGVHFHYERPVSRILREGKKCTGVRFADGSAFVADAVVCNVDLPFAYAHLLDEDVRPPVNLDKAKYTSSAYMFYWGVSRKVPSLQHHNAYLDSAYESSFADIFDRGVVPLRPSFYVNVPSRTDASMAPAGKEAVYVLVPVPDTTHAVDWSVQAPRIKAFVLDQLGRMGTPLTASEIESETLFTPADWQSTFSLARGAAFGLSHNFMQVGPFRPSNQHDKVRNLFFVGASTQPGTGVPMVMLSARLTEERVLAHFAKAGRQPVLAAQAELAP